MTEDIKTASLKASIGLAGGAISAITLNEWVAIATIVYLCLQASHLIWIWYKEAKK